MLAYLHLLNNPRDDIAFLRVINTPPRGIGKSTIARLAEHAARQPAVAVGRGPRKRADRVAQQAGRRGRGEVRVACSIGLSLRGRRAGRGNPGARADRARAISSFWPTRKTKRTRNGWPTSRNCSPPPAQFDEQQPGRRRRWKRFLEEACLVNDTDAWEADDDRVTLMTLHAAKGLEFPVVFIVALEEGLLPHERSRENDDQLEEERRLLFVGITRAREELQLSLATYREFRGQRRRTVPSPFLMELPRGEMHVVEPSAGHRRAIGMTGDAAEDAAVGRRRATSSSIRREIERLASEPPAERHAARAAIAAADDGGRAGTATQTVEVAARSARGLSPGHGRAASRVWLGQGRGAQRQRHQAHGHGGVRLGRRPEEIHARAKPASRPTKTPLTRRH